MDELERRVRAMLDDRAAALPDGVSDLSGDVAAAAARRRRRSAAAGAGIAVLAVMGVLAAALALSPGAGVGPGPVAVDSGLDGPGVAGPQGGLLMVDDEILDLSVSPARAVFEVAGAVPDPVLTRFGLLVVAGPSPARKTLWLDPGDGQPAKALAGQVISFALAADGSTVAWAQRVPGVGPDTPATLLVLARLPKVVSLHVTRLEFAASVSGFVGEAVLLDTLEGPAASLWLPETGRIVPAVPPEGERVLGRAAVTHQPSARAVLVDRQSLCGALARIGADGAVDEHRRLQLGVDCVRPFAFSPNGDLLAGAAGGTLVVRRLADDRDLLRTTTGGTLQGAVWLDRDRLLVLHSRTLPEGYQHEVMVCGISTGSCVPVWSGPVEVAPTRYRLVVRSP